MLGHPVLKACRLSGEGGRAVCSAGGLLFPGRDCPTCPWASAVQGLQRGQRGPAAHGDPCGTNKMSQAEAGGGGKAQLELQSTH